METFGKYTLEKALAKGGMAEIFLARQDGPAGFSKELVLKRILPHYAEDQAFITMFLDEARLVARLSHPNIVQIFELGEHEGSYFLAMEYVQGPSLNELIRRMKSLGVRIPLHYAAWIVAKVAAGLAYAHDVRGADGASLGLVHRDISPDNVLVTEQGAVKMIDFGVAKARDNETKTVAGTVKGKFRYMSPEQVQGKPLDGRSDIFSLGIVLYELATQTRPFGDGSDLVTVTAIVKEPPAPPSRAFEGFPQSLEAIILKALEKAPDDRYGSAAEMQADLEAFIQGHGTFVTEREVGEFVAHVLAGNDEDVAALKALPSGVHSTVAAAPSATDGAAKVSALGESPAVAAPTVAPAQEETGAGQALSPGRRGPGAAVWALFAILALGGIAFAVWFFGLRAPDGAPAGPDEPPPPVVAAVDAGAGADSLGLSGRPVTGTRRGSAEGRAERSTLESGGQSDVVAPRDVAASAPSEAEDAGQNVIATPDVAASPAPVADAASPSAAPKDVGVAGDGEPRADATAAAEPDVKPDVSAPPPEKPAVKKRPTRSYVVVRGKRGSKVTINGRAYGKRVNQKIQLAPGTYKIVLVPPGPQGRRFKRRATVRLKAGETRTVVPR